MRRFAVGLVSVLLVLSAPATAWAHGIGGRSDLPVPLEYFVVGSGFVLVITFVALAVLWTRPRLQDGPRRSGSGGIPLPLTFILRSLGVAALLLVAGEAIVDWLGLEIDPSHPGIAPVLVWVVFWLIVPYSAALLGDWYTLLNPWRGLAWALRLGREEHPLPSWLRGVYPAAALLAAFTWLELVSGRSGDGAALGTAAIVFTVAMLGAVAVWGRETAFTSLDPFTAYNRLISSISPFGRNQRGRLIWRGWLRALPALPEWPGLWLLVAAMIGTVTFDGASGAQWFRGALGGLMGSKAGQTVALLGTIGVIAAAYRLACFAAARVGGAESGHRVAQSFAHTLVPIALAYAFAHYFTLILFEGQQLIAAVSDPFRLGWDLFGTAGRRIDYFITDSVPVWYVQVGSIVAGHVVGVVLAHDRALAMFGRESIRSQYAMLALMVGLTSLGLAILAG
jgi:hypothetical protein